jgi:hypothetical protein
LCLACKARITQRKTNKIMHNNRNLCSPYGYKKVIMGEHRRERNQISEMSFPRYERTNKKIYIHKHTCTHTHTHTQETEYMQDFRLLSGHR